MLGYDIDVPYRGEEDLPAFVGEYRTGCQVGIGQIGLR